jgi:fibronectin-binding autotransporter adhesin
LSVLGADGAATSETVGGLRLLSGATTVQVGAGSGGTASVNFEDDVNDNPLSRAPGSLLNVVALNLGTTNTLYFVDTGPPRLFPVKTGVQAGWWTVNGTDFAKYSPQTGLQPLSGSDYTGSFTAGADVRLTSSAAVPGTGITVDSLNLAAGASSLAVTTAAPATLTVSQGGVLKSGSATASISGGTLASATAEINFYASGGDLTVSSQIGTSLILTKGGPGAVALTDAAPYTGGTFIWGGTLRANSSNLSGAVTDGAALVFDQSTLANIPPTGVAVGTFTGSVTGSGTIEVLGTGAAPVTRVLQLASGSTLADTGAVTIDAGAELALPATVATNVLSPNAAVVVNGALDLGGSAQTFASLSGSGAVYSSTVGSATTLTVSGGTFSGTFQGLPGTAAGSVALALTPNGTLSLAAGASVSTPAITISGGTVTIAAGSALIANALTLASGNVVSAGIVSVTGTELIGTSGSATFSQIAGTHAVSEELNLGDDTSGSASYSLDNGATLSVGGTLTIGRNDAGAFSQTGGTVNANAIILAGEGAFSAIPPAANGTYILGGGTLNVAQGVYFDRGTFTQTGGNSSLGSLQMGAGGGANFSLLGGTVSATSEQLCVYAGTGQFTQTGGTNNVAGLLSVGLDPLGSGENAVSNYNLSGTGVLRVIEEDVEPNGSLNQTGGTHVVTGELGIGSEYLPGISGVERGSFTISGGTLSATEIANEGLFTVTNVAVHVPLFTESGSTKFGGALIVGGGGTLSTDNLQLEYACSVEVQPGGVLNVAAGNLSAYSGTILLDPDAASPGRLILTGPLLCTGSSATATIASGTAATGQMPGLVDLGGSTVTFTVSRGTAAADLAISAPLTDGGIAKQGNGVLLLSSPASNFTGGLAVYNGTVVLSGPSSFTGGIVVSSASGSFGTLEVDADAELSPANTLTLAGGTLSVTDSFSTSHPIILGYATVGDGTIAVTSGSVFAVNGVLSGKTGLAAAGPGTLELNSAAQYLGQTHVTGGTLLLGPNGALSTSYLVNLDSGTTLDLGSHDRTIQALTGAGAVSLGTGTLTIADPGSANATQFSGTITGTGGVTRSGPGSLTLSGNNSFAGGLTATGGATVYMAGPASFKGGVSASAGGTVVTPSDAALGDPSNAVALSGGTLQASATFTTSRAIAVSGSGNTINIPAASSLIASGLLSGSGNLVVGGGGALRLTAGNALAGSLALTGGTLALGGAGTLTSVPSFSLSSGSTLQLDDSTASGGNTSGSRLGNSATITSGGGQIQLFGADGTSSSESLGHFTLSGGQTVVSLTDGAGPGSAAMLIFAGLSQSRRGTGILFETGDGTTLGAADQVFLGSYPVGPMPAWASVLSGGVPVSAAYDPTLGVIPASEYDSESPGLISPGGNTYKAIAEPRAAGLLAIGFGGLLLRRRRSTTKGLNGDWSPTKCAR